MKYNNGTTVTFFPCTIIIFIITNIEFNMLLIIVSKVCRQFTVIGLVMLCTPCTRNQQYISCLYPNLTFLQFWQVGVTRQSPQDLESGKVVVDCEVSPKQNETRRKSFKTRPVRVLLRRVAVMTGVLAVLVGLSATVWYFLGWKCLVQLILVAVVAYVAAGKWRWFYVALRTAPRDIRWVFI